MSEKCAVCHTLCTTFCSGCKKVYYCSSAHQKAHRKNHKGSCFPAVLTTDSNFGGRCFVSSRNIKAGEIIFKDKALVSGPSSAEAYFHRICLGCYRVVKSSYSCLNCAWPVCDSKCQQMSHHADFECVVFRANDVKPSLFTKPSDYDFINFLRSLLLKERELSKWNELLTLASHPVARAKNQSAAQVTNDSVHFIQSVCKLTQFSTDEIDHIVGVWGINSFGANPPSGRNPTCRLTSMLFPKLCLAAHNCVPNTRGVLLEDLKTSSPTYTMELIAAVSIAEGNQIHTTYANITEGTRERTLVLTDHYYFSCTCPRCADPTELGTYFSAFKCTQCIDGHVLPQDPLDINSFWKCDKCASSNISYSFLQKKLRVVQDVLETIGHEPTLANVERLEHILQMHQGKILHKNHWALMEIQYQLVQLMVRLLPKITGEVGERLSKRLIELCQHNLAIASIIQPGENMYRGKLLFCLAKGNMSQIINQSQEFRTKHITGLLNQTKRIVQECSDILKHEPDESEGNKMLKLLDKDCKHIDKMQQLFSLQISAGLLA